MQNKNKLFTVTLLSLAIAAAFTACTSTDEVSTPVAAASANAAVAAAPTTAASDASSNQLEEITLTGSRIISRGERAGIRRERAAATAEQKVSLALAMPYVAAPPPSADWTAPAPRRSPSASR